MINRAAEVTAATSSPTSSLIQALVELIDEEDLARRATFPEKADIR